MTTTYERLMIRIHDVGKLHAIGELLDWDQEVLMPGSGGKVRAEQTALIAGLAHEQLVADDTRGLLEQADAPEGDHVAATNLRETKRTFRRAASVPTDLVKELARVTSHAKSAWARARASGRFSDFAPHLTRIIELQKDVAERIGYSTEPYDALMDEYEPGVTAAEIDTLFNDLRAFTTELVERTQQSPKQPDASILRRHYPANVQAVVARELAQALGFDLAAGRIDTSVHPFCTSVGGSGDVRITTRYDDSFLSMSLFGSLHETGHALYEQGLPTEHAFTPMGESVSLGIHESQSRMWENMVGRSRAFWTCHFPELAARFPEALSSVSVEQFHGAVNAVRPSMIRVEADEVTYNLHIILRFEIERALFTGALDVDGVPDAWNEKMRAALGIVPRDDGEGCLQDIHWSMGAFGYFPTYTLGNLYAAQFMAQARRDLPDLDDRVSRGDNRPLLDWLREHIHQHGRRFRAGELVERVTGAPLSTEPFKAYITGKIEDVYGL